MSKSQDVETHIKSVETRVTQLKKKTDRFKDLQFVLPKDSYEVLITELEGILKVVDESSKSIVDLIINEFGQDLMSIQDT